MAKFIKPVLKTYDGVITLSAAKLISKKTAQRKNSSWNTEKLKDKIITYDIYYP